MPTATTNQRINMQTKLAAKVAAQNRVNEIMQSRAPLMALKLVPLIGQKVLNQGEVISSKLRQHLEPTESGPEFRLWYDASKYSIWVIMELTTREAGQYFQAKAAYKLADIDSQKYTLEAVNMAAPPAEHFRTDYTEAEILAAREDLKAANAAVSELKSKLSNFGLYDH
jgi:hypothetical protein